MKKISKKEWIRQGLNHAVKHNCICEDQALELLKNPKKLNSILQIAITNINE